MAKEKLGPGLNPSSSEFSKLSKLAPKKLGDQQASGMPDDWDYKNIERIIKIYDKAHPGRIKTMFQQVCLELDNSGINKHGGLNDNLELRKGFWLPQDLQAWVERAYPSFWRNDRHASWFCRKFPQFSFEYAAKRVKVR